MDYKPTNFYLREASKPESGQIWDFLNREDNIKLMEGAINLKKTAVEILTPWLLKEFPGYPFTNLQKQMIGSMIRQILEHIGYKHYRYDVPCIHNEIFTAGSKYKKAT